ncbi:MAG TPA: hypothetical protein VLU47_13940 [Blastocatellia bacterium]|nr:hypothetical protein [Blastocatellia bacterium]
MDEPAGRFRLASLSLAAFVLICFFLPWAELSGMGLRDSVSGFDLAHTSSLLLWLIPLSMLAVISLGLLRSIREKIPAVFALAGTVGGGASAYLIYRERLLSNRSGALIATQMTFWFWLGLLAALGVAAAAFAFYAVRSRSR